MRIVGLDVVGVWWGFVRRESVFMSWNRTVSFVYRHPLALRYVPSFVGLVLRLALNRPVLYHARPCGPKIQKTMCVFGRCVPTETGLLGRRFSDCTKHDRIRKGIRLVSFRLGFVSPVPDADDAYVSVVNPGIQPKLCTGVS